LEEPKDSRESPVALKVAEPSEPKVETATRRKPSKPFVSTLALSISREKLDSSKRKRVDKNTLRRIKR